MTENEPEFDMGDQLDNLAKTILKDAMGDKVTLSDRLEAFKICSQHHVNVQKLKKKGPEAPGDPNATNMSDLRSQIAGAGNGDSE